MTDQIALTLTVWGEARGEPIEGKIGVAMVIRNRVLAHYRGATTYVDVCRAHAQFSAWTDEANAMQAEADMLTDDPTLAHHADPVLHLCWDIARATIAGRLADNTNGANHYYATTIAAPIWARNQHILAELGKQRFYSVA